MFVIASCSAYRAAAVPSALSQTSPADPAWARTILCTASTLPGNWLGNIDGEAAIAAPALADASASATPILANTKFFNWPSPAAGPIKWASAATRQQARSSNDHDSSLNGLVRA